MKRIIKYAKFHQSLFIPGLGELGVSLPTQVKRIPDLKMSTDGNTLEVTANGNALLIPLTNVVVMHIDLTNSQEAIPAVMVNQSAIKKSK